MTFDGGLIVPSDVITTFRPRRWRVFVLMFVIGVPIWAGALAIVYAVFAWPSRWVSELVPACGLVALLAGTEAWRAHDAYMISVSDTEILGWPARRQTRTILLADLDRVRSARRSPLDRILGRQHLYSTSSAARIYLWRVGFAGSDLRQLLGLLQLDQG
jgi:hypothetical protein